MFHKLRQAFVRNEVGLELPEYAVATALLTLVVVLAFQALGQRIVALIDGIVSLIN
jgi:Flp pilus assembly pilin Flp